MRARNSAFGSIRPVTVVVAFVLLWAALLGLGLLARGLDPLPEEPAASPPVPADNAWNDFARALAEDDTLLAVRAKLSANGDPERPGGDVEGMRRVVARAARIYEPIERSDHWPFVIDQRVPSYFDEQVSPTRSRFEEVLMNPHRLLGEFGMVVDAFVLRGDLAWAEGRVQAALDAYKAALRFTGRIKSSGGTGPYVGACLAEGRVLRRLGRLAAKLDATQIENLQEVVGKQLAYSRYDGACQREAALGESWLYRSMRDDRDWRRHLVERRKASDPTFQADDAPMKRRDALLAYRMATASGTLAVSQGGTATPALVRAMLPIYFEEDQDIATANRAELTLVAVGLAIRRHLAATGILPKRESDLRPFMPRLFPMGARDPFVIRLGSPPQLRWRGLTDGAVAAWSVGPDQRDDGGRVWRSVGRGPRHAERYDPSRGDVTVILRPDGRIDFSGVLSFGASTSNSRKVGPGP